MEPWNCQESEIWATALAGSTAADAPSAAAAMLIFPFIFDSPGQLEPGSDWNSKPIAHRPPRQATTPSEPRRGYDGERHFGQGIDGLGDWHRRRASPPCPPVIQLEAVEKTPRGVFVVAGQEYRARAGAPRRSCQAEGRRAVRDRWAIADAGRATYLAFLDAKRGTIDRRRQSAQERFARYRHVLAKRQYLAVSHRLSAARSPVHRRSGVRAWPVPPGERSGR